MKQIWETEWIDFSRKVVTTKLNLEREDGSRVITIEEIEKLALRETLLFIYNLTDLGDTGNLPYFYEMDNTNAV